MLLQKLLQYWERNSNRIVLIYMSKNHMNEKAIRLKKTMKTTLHNGQNL